MRGIATELFAPKGDTSGVMKLLMIVVFFAAGGDLDVDSIHVQSGQRA